MSIMKRLCRNFIILLLILGINVCVIEASELGVALASDHQVLSEAITSRTPSEFSLADSTPSELRMSPMGMTSPTSYADLKALIESAPTDGSLYEIGFDKFTPITKTKADKDIQLKPGQNVLLSNIKISEQSYTWSKLSKSTIHIPNGAKLALNTVLIENPWFDVGGGTGIY